MLRAGEAILELPLLEGGTLSVPWVLRWTPQALQSGNCPPDRLQTGVSALHEHEL